MESVSIGFSIGSIAEAGITLTGKAIAAKALPYILIGFGALVCVSLIVALNSEPKNEIETREVEGEGQELEVRG